ncbi:MAG TPA: hypothetical protein VHB68_08100 [Steroidobacteraceae bacterium]|nr:hypothetical protein [Steroidobacteraceae bacterium]
MTEQLRRREGTPQPLRLGQLQASIASVSYQPTGRAIIGLDNGQVWEETETRTDLDLHKGETVSITPGVLGAFFLSGNGSNKSVKVKRTR